MVLRWIEDHIEHGKYTSARGLSAEQAEKIAHQLLGYLAEKKYGTYTYKTRTGNNPGDGSGDATFILERRQFLSKVPVAKVSYSLQEDGHGPLTEFWVYPKGFPGNEETRLQAMTELQQQADTFVMEYSR